jgi:predicted Zn-dependent protease
MNKRLTYLKQLIDSGKADAFAHYAFAMEYKKEGQIAEAAQAFEQLNQTFPDYVPQYLMAGQMHLDHNQPELARSWLSRGLLVAKQAGDGKAAGEIEAALALC